MAQLDPSVGEVDVETVRFVETTAEFSTEGNDFLEPGGKFANYQHVQVPKIGRSLPNLSWLVVSNIF